MKRSVEEIVSDVIERMQGGKFTGSLGLTDFDPLVVVMNRLAWVMENKGATFDKPKARKVWLLATMEIQEDSFIVEHNRFTPCRYCETAFEPVVDDRLLDLFLAWNESIGSTEKLLDIHRCEGCGGTIKSKGTKKYQGDFHTPEPGSIDDDELWCHDLLQHHWF